MPIRWTAELDSILLHGVFEECSISFSKPLCAKIAERVTAAGLECSAKAVENRLYSWKRRNLTSTITTTNDSTPNTPSKAAATPKTPRSRAKATPRKKKVASDESDEASPDYHVHDNIDGDGGILSPLAARGKRSASGDGRKPSYIEPDSDKEDEEDYVPMNKRVKREPVDDEDDATFEDGATNGDEEVDEV